MLPRAEQRQCHPDARRFHSVPPSAAPRPVATSSRTLPPRRWHGLWTPLSLICPYALYHLVCLPSSAEQTPCSLQAARKEEVPWTTGGPAGLHPRPSWPGRGHLQTQFPYCSKQGNRIDRFICLLNLMITMGKMMIVLVLFHCLILIFNLFYLNFILQTVSVHTYWKWKGKKKITKTKANPALVPHHRNLEKQSVEDPVSKAQEGWGLQIRQPEVQRKLQERQGLRRTGGHSGRRRPQDRLVGKEAEDGSCYSEKSIQDKNLPAAKGIFLSLALPTTSFEKRSLPYCGPEVSAQMCVEIRLPSQPPAHTRPPPEKWHRRQFGKKNAWMISWFHICVSRALPTRLLKRILRFYKNRSPPPKKRKTPKSLQCSLLVFKQR